MIGQITALGIVVIGFTGLIAWVYWPGNAERFVAGSRLALEETSSMKNHAGDGEEVNNESGA